MARNDTPVDSKDIALIVWVVIIFAGSIALLGGWGLLVGAVLAALYLRWMGASRE